MKLFLTESVLPVAGVVIAIIVLTLALFEVPSREPDAVAGLRVPATVGPIAASPSARAHVDDALSRVMRTLDEGRRQAELPSQPVKPASARNPGTAIGTPAGNAPMKLPAAPTAPAATALPVAASKLLDATNALATAVRAIHEARTEEDIVRAEELVRAAREQMQANCATAPGPLCESADQIRSLGY